MVLSRHIFNIALILATQKIEVRFRRILLSGRPLAIVRNAALKRGLLLVSEHVLNHCRSISHAILSIPLLLYPLPESLTMTHVDFAPFNISRSGERVDPSPMYVVFCPHPA